ncbi:MAG: hypothetical protein KDA89_24405, partial [Planctomycetaceae bacterium]|nr:hypothetical protein [Planctomycetaceae bacterium]
MTETESVPQLSQFSPESRRLQAALLLTYAAAGISAALLLRLSASGQPMPMRGSLLTACVLFGVAVRTAVDASVNRLLGTIASWAGSLLLIAAADLAIGFSPLPTTGTVAALVLGFGYIPPWSTADRWVNAELGYRFRWRAQRLFVMAWSGGLTFGCL